MFKTLKKVYKYNSMQIDWIFVQVIMTMVKKLKTEHISNNLILLVNQIASHD